MSPGATNSTWPRLAWALLVGVLATRLLTMALYPVMDSTESRYAEMARLMVESGSWLMPQFEPGVPFWGKPPLFAWLSGSAFELLGVSAFAARLPHFALGLGTLWLVLSMARHEPGRRPAVLAAALLASMPLFYVSTGAVMTESALLFSTTLSMAGFWIGTQTASRAWGLAFFAGLGLGMLAKGPVAVVMTLLPIGMWLLSQRQLGALARLPWLSGIALALLIALPWYLAAEAYSPGFLSYFLVGEHLLRFLQPGWEGDLYGNAHAQPRGMIWLYWLQAGGAWSLVALAGLVQARKARLFADPWRRYLLCWMIAPLLFFSFSTNILWTYVISGLPALALLLVAGRTQREAAT
ncbi:MAG: glycosyltransferase family 39 protein [Xanthomonadales bacterium]|nr:glycosyltransferase family 39 protein [Xanthomonadales bacterium]